MEVPNHPLEIEYVTVKQEVMEENVAFEKKEVMEENVTFEDSTNEMEFKDEPLDVDFNNCPELDKNSDFNKERFKSEPDDVHEVNPLEMLSSRRGNILEVNNDGESILGLKLLHENESMESAYSHNLTFGEAMQHENEVGTTSGKKSRKSVVGDNFTAVPRAKDNTKSSTAPKSSEKKLSCPFCEKEYRREGSLATHINMHQNSAHKCTICKIQFKTEQHLTLHLDVYHNNKFQCDQCPFEGRALSELETHMKKHESVTHQCSVCNKIFKTETKLTKHMELHDFTFRCKRCPYEVKKLREFNLHMWKHENYHQCSICNIFLKKEKLLAKHVDEHDCVFRCSQCPFETDTSRRMMIHVQTHKSYSLKCSICNRPCKNKMRLTKHIQEHKKFKCNRCPFEAYTVQEKILHLRTHNTCKMCGVDSRMPHNRTQKPHCIEYTPQPTKSSKETYQCGLCALKFTDLAAFFIHRRQHTAAKCQDCGETSTFRALPVIHRLSHLGSEAHKCSVCDKTFSEKTTLRFHEDTHNNQEKYCCKICSADFEKLSDLAKHRLVHVEQSTQSMVDELRTKYSKGHRKCVTCGEIFKDFIEYIKHIQSHWQDRDDDLKCSVCNKSFTKLSQLVTHRKNHE